MKIFLFMDITQVKETEKKKLEIKFKHIFLSSVSHNLKTPLNSKLFSPLILLSTRLNNQQRDHDGQVQRRRHPREQYSKLKLKEP